MATVLLSRAAILLQHQANPTHRPLIRSHRLARPPCPSWLRSRQPRRDAGLRRARKGRPPNPNSPHRSCPRPTAWEEHRTGEEVRIINEEDFTKVLSPLPFQEFQVYKSNCDHVLRRGSAALRSRSPQWPSRRNIRTCDLQFKSQALKVFMLSSLHC